jgi:hypothetical protein
MWEHITKFPGLVTTQLFPASAAKKCSGEQFVSTKEVIAKVTRVLTVISKKWFSEILPKASQRLEKMSLSKETTMKEMLGK